METYPEYLNACGPHGFTFLHHAQKGVNDAKGLLEYFHGNELNETKTKL
ncbi:MAG: hypothetical protein ABIO76_07640 [Ginsengibacter sp.]